MNATPDARRRLAEQQAALLRALLDDGPPPTDVDPARLAAQRRVLAAKARRTRERAAG